LVLRVWSEPDSPDVLRARLVERGTGSTVATAVGDTEIGREVQRWLLRLRTGPEPAAGPAGAAVPPLLDAAWLAGHRADPGVALLQVSDGVPAREAGYLAGAARLDWIGDLQDPDRRTFLDAGGFAALMDRLGVGADTHVVLCGGRSAELAAWAYWCLTYHGHPRISLLDGGLAGWVAQGGELAAAPATRRPTTGYVPGPGRRDLLVTRDQLLGGLVGAPPGTALIDCREAGEFAGRPRQPYDRPTDRHRMVGHIPGAFSLPVEDLLGPDGRLLPPQRLRERCVATGAVPADQVVVYCGVSDRSALVWFVLHELLGWTDVACYYGAWAEYGSLVGVPVDRDRPAAPSGDH
jgi:thiosulfate/3-mercaptopyruvate sulfurtransferase